jgi:hypothetical protein
MPEFLNRIGINIEDIEDDEPVNIFFDENGFQSKQFLRNAGSALFFLMFYAFAWIILILVKGMAKYWQVFIPF